ncbi:MAG: hypothetical protein JNK84_10840 [Phreatobacter sp.]|uniref:hypothetical protein n=1 Tax=Phreatobacter sp. TaxID=1966341 RepID=UPI001A558029|nr:hypothetical protein [Phreatobacter sp.]MBL8569569.1 hypothetical protein [Phreatobacter sp.]
MTNKAGISAGHENADNVVDFSELRSRGLLEVHGDELIGAFNRLFRQIAAVNNLVVRSDLPEDTKTDVGCDLIQTSMSAFTANTKLLQGLLKKDAV